MGIASGWFSFAFWRFFGSYRQLNRKNWVKITRTQLVMYGVKANESW